MSNHSHTDKVQLTLLVPRGQDGFWTVMRQLNAEGRPWSRRDVYDRCNADRTSIGDYIRRLIAAGFVAKVGELPNRGTGNRDAHLYRLIKTQHDAPRVTRKGELLPEPTYATLWRTMKMAKQFTIRELTALASTPERPIALRYSITYVTQLEAAGIVSRSANLGHVEDRQFRLVRNLGPKAPSIMKTRVVFDPNSRQVIGEAEASEVRP